MPNTKMIASVLREYGASWAVNRSVYSLKLKGLQTAPVTEQWYEKKTAYPKQTDLFQIHIETLKNQLQTLEEEDKEILIQTAEKACKGIILGFSSTELDYGQPMDWQKNPLSGKRCDEAKKWYHIPDFDPERGDIKVIWEASRFSHFLTLARAWLLTDNEIYYTAFHEQLEDWLKRNPYGYGANYKCGQECSLRMVNAMLAYTVFRTAGKATDADESHLKDLIDRCYRKILSNFFYADRCIKNNHTISELMGMIVGAWCCEDQKLLEKAYRHLDDVIASQFTEDGGYGQFSFTYQRLALQDLECVLSMKGKTGFTLSTQSMSRLRNAARLMYQCQDACGDMPNYGSNDGALVFPVSACGYRDFRPVINAVYALIDGTQPYPADKHQEELIWFSGGRPLEDFPISVEERCSAQFPEAGLFTLREKNAWAMTVLNAYRSRPAHMDQLHFDLWANGVNLFCDAGTYSYASDTGRRMIRNESHNTAAVPNKTQMNQSGPFLINSWTKRKSFMWKPHTFSGVCESENGYTHARKARADGSGFEITDLLDQDGCILFHTPCDVELTDGKARLSWHGNQVCELQSSALMELRKSSRSVYYLKQQETNCIVLQARAGTTVTTRIQITEGDTEHD